MSGALAFPKPVKRIKPRRYLRRGKGPRRFRKGGAAALKRRLDRLWSEIVHRRDPMCRLRAVDQRHVCYGPLQADHLISRRKGGTRHLPEVGARLCAKAHSRVTHDWSLHSHLALRLLGAQEYDRLLTLAQKPMPRRMPELREIEAALQKVLDTL